MVDRPEDYRWSSYAGYMRARRIVGWLTYDRVLGEFGDDLTAARRAYGRFVVRGWQIRRLGRLPTRWAACCLGRRDSWIESGRSFVNEGRTRVYRN